MTFSIRFFFSVVALFALIIGALISKNTVFMELAAGIVFATFALALTLAIWDSQQKRRPFWTGYFAVGVASAVFGSLNTYAGTSNQIASWFGEVQVEGSIIGFDQNGVPIRSQSLANASQGNTGNTRIATSTITRAQLNVIQSSLPVFFAFIAAIIGGCLATVISGSRDTEKANGQQ